MTTMADMSRFARNKNPHLPKNSSPLSKTYIGNFRKKLVDHEIFFIQQLSKRYMLLFGYPLIPIQISQSKSNPLYLLHWFIGAIQMISWRMWNMVA
jgi:hypothetical protein